ncbi:MAG: hypothetical protein ABWY20_13130 [Mycobacterium sp.]
MSIEEFAEKARPDASRQQRMLVGAAFNLALRVRRSHVGAPALACDCCSTGQRAVREMLLLSDKRRVEAIDRARPVRAAEF